MGLSLTAEQKEILKIYKIEEQYIVPAFQRPYSWEYDQCFQLYSDLIEAYKTQEDYFVGNIIIAKSEANKEVLEVIDGQQRLITILLLIKVLHILLPELKVLNQILEKEDWEGTGTIPRIQSDIFEANDGKHLLNVLKFSKSDFDNKLDSCIDKNGKINEKKCTNRFEVNILYFYNWLTYYNSKHDDLKEFTSFLLRNVFLLPIELSGKTQDEANEKALVIFETINNRGMNLEDADIFKAKLYKKAKKVGEEEIFIQEWIEFKANCNSLGLQIDDIFRYYSHIIRGQKEITSSERNLREFFTQETYSPFELKKYKDILNDLFKIIEVLEFINQEKFKSTELAKWIQIIEVYTNQYPKFALVVFLFRNGFDSSLDLIDFLKSLIRYVYFYGSTTRVKFEIYTIIKQISIDKPIDNYFVEVDVSHFDYLGRLKYGYALLAFYLTKEKALQTYNVDKLISYNDREYFESSWKDVEGLLEALGNFVILDIPKRNLPLIKKSEYYQHSSLDEVKHILRNGISFQDLNNRDLYLKKILVNFFNGNNR